MELLSSEDVSHRIFAGDGEMRALCRSFEWENTPLGPVERWSQSLRTTVAILLASRHPMFLWWGPELIQLYNDGYRPSLAGGGRHPRALGMRGPEFWTEIWDIIGPQISAVMTRGEPSWHVDQLVAIERNGRMEEVYWTYGYSPVLDDDDSVGGTLVVCQETTNAVIAARRTRTLHRLALIGPQQDAAAAATAAVATLAADQNDVPFALCYLDAAALELAGSARVATTIAAARWPCQPAMAAVQPCEVDVSGWIEFADASPWPEPITTAALVPLVAPGETEVLGLLVLGLSPRLSFDAAYRDFVGAAATQIATQIARQHAEEALLESELRHRLAVDAALLGTWTWDLTNNTSTIDERVRSLFGWTEPRTSPPWDVLSRRIHPDDRERVERALAAAADPASDGRYEAEYRIVRPDGSECWVRSRARMYFSPDDNRKPLRMVGTLRDVTERRRTIEQLQRAHEEAQRARAEAELANRAKGDFLATMSHELRTPLNAIGGYTELLELGVLGPVTTQQVEALTRIQTSQRHLLGLINEVLNYTRLEAGAVQYDIAPVPVAAVLKACEALIAPQVRARQLTFRIEVADPNLAVFADEEKLRQIVLNLLSNAIKFTPPGGSVSARGCDLGGQAAIEIVDSGRGIPASQLQRVFEPFVQIDVKRTPDNEGVGLGLAISRDLARAMSGDITAISREGAGSTFTVLLPRADYANIGISNVNQLLTRESTLHSS